MSKKTVVLVFAFALALVVLGPAPAAASSACSADVSISTSTGNLASASPQPPRIEDIVFVSEETRPFFGGYVKTRFPYIFVTRYRWESVKGAPRATLRHYVDRNNNAVEVTEIPELGLTRIEWEVANDFLPNFLHPGKTRYEGYEAVRIADGPQIIGKAGDLILRGDEYRTDGIVTTINLVGCVGGNFTMLASIPLVSPISVRADKQFYGYGLDCEAPKKN